MQKLMIYILISYAIGSASPSAFFAKLKKRDLRQAGTGNLGATNAMLVLGKAYGIAVMLLDIGKGYLCTALAKGLSGEMPSAPIIAGCAAIVGHMFPFYLRFRGGKGLAAFGGMVLAFDPYIFMLLLPIAAGLMLITDRIVTMPIAGAVLFPVFCAAFGYGATCTAMAAAAGALVAARHFGNLKKTVEGRDLRIKEYLKGLKPPQ